MIIAGMGELVLSFGNVGTEGCSTCMGILLTFSSVFEERKLYGVVHLNKFEQIRTLFEKVLPEIISRGYFLEKVSLFYSKEDSYRSSLISSILFEYQSLKAIVSRFENGYIYEGNHLTSKTKLSFGEEMIHNRNIFASFETLIVMSQIRPFQIITAHYPKEWTFPLFFNCEVSTGPKSSLSVREFRN